MLGEQGGSQPHKKIAQVQWVPDHRINPCSVQFVSQLTFVLRPEVFLGVWPTVYILIRRPSTLTAKQR